jgi:hypothetical protein
MRVCSEGIAEQDCKWGYLSRRLSREMPFQVKSRSAGEQAMWRRELKSLQKGITTLSEASLRHLLITPPSHFTTQKVKGLVVSLLGYRWDNNNAIKKYSCANGLSSGKLPPSIGCISRPISKICL